MTGMGTRTMTGEALRCLRMELGLSPEEAARRVGTTAVLLLALERAPGSEVPGRWRWLLDPSGRVPRWRLRLLAAVTRHRSEELRDVARGRWGGP